jgi:hypothetical protein
VEHRHFNAVSHGRQGERAALVGCPPFVGLRVGPEGMAFECCPVNVEEMTALAVYRPLAGVAGKGAATVVAFLNSGALRELVIERGLERRGRAASWGWMIMCGCSPGWRRRCRPCSTGRSARAASGLWSGWSERRQRHNYRGGSSRQFCLYFWLKQCQVDVSSCASTA